MSEFLLKTITTVTKWLFILVIPLFLLAIVIQIGSHEAIRLYEYNFEKYDTSWDITSSTGLEKTTVITAARGLMGVFHSDEDMAHINVVKNGSEMNLFNEREQIHLKDVKGLLRIGYYLFWISLAYILLYVIHTIRFNKQEKFALIRSTLAGSTLTLGLIIVFGVVAAVNPEQVFLQFHLISFNNPFWLLDPAKDYLIMMFPEDYFYDIAIYGIGAIIIEALILISASKLILKKYATELT